MTVVVLFSIDDLNPDQGVLRLFSPEMVVIHTDTVEYLIPPEVRASWERRMATGRLPLVLSDLVTSGRNIIFQRKPSLEDDAWCFVVDSPKKLPELVRNAYLHGVLVANLHTILSQVRAHLKATNLLEMHFRRHGLI